MDPDLYLSELKRLRRRESRTSALGGAGRNGKISATGIRLSGGRAGGITAPGQVREPHLRCCRETPSYPPLADGSGFVGAGGGEGLYVSKGEDWENLRGAEGTTPGTPFRMVRSAQGILCEVWDNQLELLVPGQPESRSLEVPGEMNMRVIELLRMPAGDVYLVTSQGVYRFEGEEFKGVAWSEDPIMSASVYGQVDIVLGKNSGEVTLFSPGSGREELLGSIGEPVEHLSSSTPGLLYVQSGGNIYFSRDLVFAPSRLTHQARWEVDTGSAGVVSIKLPLPVSEYLAPEWFYYAVRPAAGEVSWEIRRENPTEDELFLRESPGTIGLEVLAVASPADTYRFEQGGSKPFPAVFPEEVRPYLLPGRGISLDLPELPSIIGGIPSEVRADTVSLALLPGQAGRSLLPGPLRRRGTPTSVPGQPGGGRIRTPAGVPHIEGGGGRRLCACPGFYRSLPGGGHAGPHGPLLRPFLQPGIYRRRGLDTGGRLSPGLRLPGPLLSAAGPLPGERIPSSPGRAARTTTSGPPNASRCPRERMPAGRSRPAPSSSAGPVPTVCRTRRRPFPSPRRSVSISGKEAARSCW